MTDRRSTADQDLDAALQQAWHQHCTEQASTDIDASIRAAARREVDSAPAREPQQSAYRYSPNWMRVAAAAAVAVLAFGLVQLMPVRQEVAPAGQPATSPADRADESVEASEPRRSAPESVSTKKSTVVRDADDYDPTPFGDDIGRPASPAVSAPATVPVRPRTAVPEMASQAAARSEGTGEQRAERSAESDVSPTAWAGQVADLYERGEYEAAANELSAFRIAHPGADEFLEEPLRTWAETIPR